MGDIYGYQGLGKSQNPQRQWDIMTDRRESPEIHF